MINIIHAIGSLSKGGAEFQCRQLANNLDPSRYKISILCFDEGPTPKLASHVRPIFVNRGSKWDLIGLWRRIHSIIKDERPDVVQAWLPEVISVPAALTAKIYGIPLICGHRNTLAFEKDLTKVLRDLLRLPQYIVSDRIVSNFDINEEPFLFRWLYACKQGSCILNGIDVKALRTLLPNVLHVRAQHRLIFAGRLAPQKGLPVALRAIRCLVDSGYDVHLTIFGEGAESYVAELMDLVVELSLKEHVTFLGPCSEWQAYAGDATAIIFPTKGEGTSNVALEALSVGLPLVISDIAMSRQLLSDSVNALVVADSSPEEWASRIGQILTSASMKKKLSREGMKLSEQFAVSTMVTRYEQLYKELVIK